MDWSDGYIKNAKTKEAKRRCFSEFERMIEMSMHHPMMRELYIDSEEDHMLFREMPRILMRNIERLMNDGE